MIIWAPGLSVTPGPCREHIMSDYTFNKDSNKREGKEGEKQRWRANNNGRARDMFIYFPRKTKQEKKK